VSDTDSTNDAPAAEIPFPPMEAELVRELPEGDGWQYEPKWDGFRGVLENVGGELALWSRNGRPLLRYFPELRPLGELLPPRSALDGEVVIVRAGALDFDSMQMRLHPAESRIRKLSAEIPARYVVFDVLLWDGEPVWQRPLEERRAELERVNAMRPSLSLSPCTRSVSAARGWLDRFEALGLDGVIAKRLGVPYLPGSRDGVVKVKEHKSADCVVVGFRWKGSDRDAIATLLLGLYRDDGGLDYVGTCAVAAKSRADVAAKVLPLAEDDPDWHASEPTRWGTGELEQARVRPELVVEVRYDKVQGSRFRHGTKLIRWRGDKDPADCTWRELRPPADVAAGGGVESLFSS
jgi:ATP-dependent DNA ligase